MFPRRLGALVLAAALLLTGCGGGGGSSSSSAPPPPATPAAPRTDLQFGYYATVDGQIAATAAHVTFIHAIDWGDWDSAPGREAIKQRIIAQLQEARARGVPWSIISTSFLQFSADFKTYRGVAEVAAFKAELDALDLSRTVIGLYPVDEPDMHGVSDAVMTQAVRDLKAAWPGPKVAVIYGDHGTPGLAAFDWIGRDDYPRGAGALDELPPLGPGQQWIVVPGGANPWRNDPSPFADFAEGRKEVAVVMPFLWGDFVDPNGTPQLGIGRNGMAPAYAAVGDRIRGATP